ncbi:MAG: M20/M25/M40 family metallo-hydrolase [Deltaproteobacteria bacterium]
MDVIELTKELVAIPSVTNDEGEVCRLVIDRLEAAGWLVTTQEIAPEDGATPALPRLNVLARVADRTPDVVLTTHLDTVPPFIPPTEDDARIYGRGTCDAKGIFAAQWIAAERLRAEGHEGIALMGVVGEETDSIGAKLIAPLLPAAKWIIDGEPTQMKFASGAKGILALAVTAKGKAGHSAYPEVGHNALHDLVPALARLISAELPFEERYGQTTVNIGVMNGGVAPNVLAPAASARVMIRLGTTVEKVLPEVRSLLGDALEVEITSTSEPHPMPVPDGQDADVVKFGSDVPYLMKLGKTMLVGPGSIHDAHTSHEKIEKQELLDAVELYADVARMLLTAEGGAA